MSGKPRTSRIDVAATVTKQIIAALEEGQLPWRCPWRKAGGSLPRRHSGEPYRGINILLLGLEAYAAGYASPYWMTYRQATQLGAQVRKGERSTLVVYYGSAERRKAAAGGDDDEPGTYRFLKSYRAFNVDQIDHLSTRFHLDEADLDAGGRPIDALEAFFGRMNLPVRIGGDVAAYRPGPDHIVMPPHERFADSEKWYATLCHEAAHYTGGEKRLNRELDRCFSEDITYLAEEEMIAELASAMMGAHLGFASTHIEDHAQYIAHWLKRLRSDNRFIFKAAAEAQRAVDWMLDAAGGADALNDIASAA